MRDWWHAGEENAIAIYAGSWKWRFVMRCMLMPAIALLLVAELPMGRIGTGILLAGLGAFTACPLIGDRRRAIIFTERTVAYRPMFTAPHEIAYGKILGLRRGKAFFFPGRSPTPAIVLDLPDGAIEAWPWLFEDPTGILDRLTAATGKPVIQA